MTHPKNNMQQQRRNAAGLEPARPQACVGAPCTRIHATCSNTNNSMHAASGSSTTCRKQQNQRTAKNNVVKKNSFFIFWACRSPKRKERCRGKRSMKMDWMRDSARIHHASTLPEQADAAREASPIRKKIFFSG